MNYDELYEILNKGSASGNTYAGAREDLVSVLKKLSAAMIDQPDSTVETAYRIVGLASTDYVRQLSDGDVIDEIMTIAGELEVNPPNADELRDELIRAIEVL